LKKQNKKLNTGEFLVREETVADKLIEILNRLFKPGRPLVNKVPESALLDLQQILQLKPQRIQQIADGIRVDFGLEIRQIAINKNYFRQRMKKITKKKKRLSANQAKKVTDLAVKITKGELKLNEIHQEVFQKFKVLIPQHLTTAGFRRNILFRREKLDSLMTEVSTPKRSKSKRWVGLRPSASKKPTGDIKEKKPWWHRRR